MASQLALKEYDRVILNQIASECPSQKYRGPGYYVFENGPITTRAWAVWSSATGDFELFDLGGYPLKPMPAEAFDALASDLHHGNAARDRARGWTGSIAA